MQVSDSIKSGLEYIEQNLKTIITAEELASMAGYSVWHYCRVFAQTTGMTVAYYICKRRIDSAFTEISNGRRAVDVILEYGFDTYAGFYKAFVRMYGCSPKKYLIKGGHNMIKERELRDILANWDIPQDLPITDTYIMDGARASGRVWEIGDRFILKTGERDSLLKDLRLHKALARQGFAKIAPVTTKSSAEYLDGDSIAVLRERIPGAPLGKDERFGNKRRDLGFKYGAGIARLHRALSEIEADIMPDETNLYRQITEWAIPRVKEQNARYGLGLSDCFFEDYTNTFGALFDKLPKQLIHRDSNPSNILFDGGEVSGFVDFDLCERNVRLWDPCYCATGILSECRGVENIYEKWPDILNGILYGYDSENPLTAEEKQAVFYVICSIQMVFLAWLERQVGDGFAELAQTNREMCSFIARNKARISSIF